MAGGAGTRLWPLSTEERPKQFLPLLSEKSLLAETYARVLPIARDVFVADADAFRRALAAGEKAAESASIVVFAVPPTRPETDYGYLEVREDTAEDGIEVVRFIEKPSAAQAEEHLQAGFFWNAGICVFRPSRL